MEERLIKRGETSGRVDDNAETIKKRFSTFVEETLPVIESYGEKNKLKKVRTVNSIVFLPPGITCILILVFWRSHRLSDFLSCFSAVLEWEHSAIVSAWILLDFLTFIHIKNIWTFLSTLHRSSLFPFVWRLRILLKFSMCRHNVSILESPFKQFERLRPNIHQGNVDKMMKLCPVKAYSSLNWSVWTGFQRDLTPLNAFNNVGWYS